ncbi:SigE family RNA polymerase sigma factor [Actinacidiphila acidipaludis]|uniref:SigE family RNA polymerase sigma factor n=1 Tax=Actinacidiphila acidipaludis TaxID=2873382 RepID=A0ABS7QGH6_9ACTN|nr:SigE family RNA polymerase sigma factor [Streptomyces acidipaludis]MBY8882277.1 SigE family RNA polymerase sigma factor [Streptomyces acidipaludis]
MRRAATEAYKQFAAARAGQLFRSACLLVGGDTHLAEDLVQETLGRMYVVWGRMGKVDNPAGYAQTVLVRIFLTHQRRRSSRESPAADLPDRAGRDSSGDASLRVTLLAALSALPPKDRAVLVLRYWEDRSVEETAAVLQSSPGAVRTRTTRALARLRRELDGSLVDLVAG